MCLHHNAYVPTPPTTIQYICCRPTPPNCMCIDVCTYTGGLRHTTCAHVLTYNIYRCVLTYNMCIRPPPNGIYKHVSMCKYASICMHIDICDIHKRSQRAETCIYAFYVCMFVCFCVCLCLCVCVYMCKHIHTTHINAFEY